MSSLSDAVLDANSIFDGNTASANLQRGGQQGFMPNIGAVDADGKLKSEWISNQSYISQNLIPIVLDYPRFFDLMPNKDLLIAMYKELIEKHPLAIEGLNNTLTVETDETEIGGGGEFQEEVTDVKKERSQLSFTWKEKANKTISKFLDFLITHSMMDQDTKTPVVRQYIDSIDDIGGIYTPDFYTGTILFIEPDITKLSVVDAYLSTNVFFKGTGERNSRMELRAAGEGKELSVEAASITMSNNQVFKLATEMLSNMNVLDKIADEDFILPTDEINSSVSAADAGYNK